MSDSKNKSRPGFEEPQDGLSNKIGTAFRSPRWRWMLPWTLAAIGVAVTIAWILQPAPQPQFGVRQGGPGGGRGGGARPNNQQAGTSAAGKQAMVADATKKPRANLPPGADQGT